MSSLGKLSLLPLLGLSLTIGVSPSWAAEHGTYRPGSPYQSVPTQDAPTCEIQCRADRDCRGWNFVKVSPRQMSGVCEFNAQSVAPISSAISISGDGSVGQVSSRLVSKGTRTIRVGTPESQNPTQIHAVPHNAPQSRQRVIREPIPFRETVSPSHYRAPNPAQPAYSALSLTQQQALQRHGYAPHTQTRPVTTPPQPQRSVPRLMHSLEGGLSSAQQHNRLRQNTIPYAAPRDIPMGASPRLQHSLDSNSLTRSQDQNRPIDQGHAAHSTQQSRQSTRASNGAANLYAQPSRAQQYAQTAPTPKPNQKAQTLANSQAQAQVKVPQTFKAAEASLFGSLYDDVAQPKPMTQLEMTDPSTPISTAQSVPAKKYNAETLMNLAGN